MLVLAGAAYSLPFHIAVSSAGTIVPLTTDALLLPVHGTIQPAWANSASQVTSSAMMSIVASCAASRRTSCWRWPSAAAGSCWKEILYAPWLCALQLAISVFVAAEVSGYW